MLLYSEEVEFIIIINLFAVTRSIGANPYIPKRPWIQYAIGSMNPSPLSLFLSVSCD